MAGDKPYLAFDLGAESGRAVAGTFRGGSLAVQEIHRFPNEPVRYNGALHWDVARLWLEMNKALRIAAREHSGMAGIGVDSWGLDYALLGAGGTLLDNPHHYRDARTDGMIERVCAIVPAEAIYEQTGIQFMQINALYQLYAANLSTPALLRCATHLVTIPDLFNYWLSGIIACEFTNATTTQFFDIRRHTWASTLLEQLGLPTHLLGPIVEPGTVLGCVRADVRSNCGLGETVVIAPACHDTGSAVAAISLGERSAYISSGTWSLLGAEIASPIINAEALKANFTNEGGADCTVRLLKNIMGMWLLQGCRRHWSREGSEFEYEDLTSFASACRPLEAVVDPDHSSFLRCDNMPAAIADFCDRTGQRAPDNPGAFTRSVLESLALKYRYVLEALQRLTGTEFDEVRVVGGGARNRMLNQFTAEATGRRVVAGPIEATALGNLALQLLATGEVTTLKEARSVIDRSFPTEIFEPRDPAAWDEVYPRFREYCEARI